MRARLQDTQRQRKPAAFFVAVGVPIAAIVLSMALLGIALWTAPEALPQAEPELVPEGSPPAPMSKTSWRGGPDA
jgi:hypothetical protein